MASSFIHFDNKHISTAQLAMVDDQDLKGFIHNLSKSAPNAIHDHLQDEGFLHTSHMLRGCKLDHTLISADGWASHYGGSGYSDKEDLCDAFLGKVLNKFQDGQIKMKWLKDNFNKLDDHAIALKKEQYALAFIPRIIGGILMPNKSSKFGTYKVSRAWWWLPFLCPRVDAPLYIPTGDKVKPWAELRGTTKATQKYPVVVRSTIESRDNKICNCALQFKWMSYADLKIVQCILHEYLANRSMWDANVPLVVYAMVEMNESDRGKNDKNLRELHKKYIDIWDYRNDFIPMHKPFFAPKTTTSAKYMPWFRLFRKPYLLSIEARSRQIRLKRPR
ncbi:hypothetical protein Goari_004582 [Gossypium aridum]|uniref:Uncharacterized protein n=1 Tax=Gossypium aridum TaxID=34290 RepID=A0A7J8Y3X1_GOSAI|nr:hypothetical protein [Gossypium aridum]